MRLLGLDITRATKSGVAPMNPANTPALMQAGYNSGGWYNIIREGFSGAWQRNVQIDFGTVLTNSTVYSCATLIASDIAKVRIKLVEQNADGIWSETTSAAFSPVLRKPNRYQTRIKFFEQWVMSKLFHGNAYILKERDNRGAVVAMYVLDPHRVRPLVAPDGSVYYALGADYLAGIETALPAIPASEIIHDVMSAIYHPLIGVSPIHACGLAAMQGLKIQAHSAAFFANGANPGGILTAPGLIDEVTATRIKNHWDTNYSGQNSGKVAVLGDGLKYEAMTMKSTDAQLIEQLKWTAETVCSCFHVPGFMVGVGGAPTYTNVEALSQQYYSQCLQTHIESMELLLDEGLGLTAVTGKTYGTEFDLDDLLRMDSATKVKAVSDGIGGGIYTPNEGRKKFDLKPIKGGDTVYLQVQNFSLEALAKRDASDNPFGLAPHKDQVVIPPDGPAGTTEAAASSPANDAPPPAKRFDPSRFAQVLERKLAA